MISSLCVCLFFLSVPKAERSNEYSLNDLCVASQIICAPVLDMDMNYKHSAFIFSVNGHDSSEVEHSHYTRNVMGLHSVLNQLICPVNDVTVTTDT